MAANEADAGQQVGSDKKKGRHSWQWQHPRFSDITLLLTTQGAASIISFAMGWLTSLTLLNVYHFLCINLCHSRRQTQSSRGLQ
jgi:hypothetical protein